MSDRNVDLLRFLVVLGDHIHERNATIERCLTEKHQLTTLLLAWSWPFAWSFGFCVFGAGQGKQARASSATLSSLTL
jgi:hypothetical protein